MEASKAKAYSVLGTEEGTGQRSKGSTIKNGHREQSEPGSIYEVAIGMSGSLLVPSLGPRR